MQTSTQKDEKSWDVGVLFSRSGVTEVTESEHFFGTALAIEEINAAGGILGRNIEVAAYDPGADDAAYRKLARRLLSDDGTAVIFGGSTSASRKAILPIVERYNGLLFYPSMYEGFEYSENVLYSGATLNQNTFALADYLLNRYGSRVFLVGSDYIYPRESNRVMRDLIQSKGGEVVDERYVPLHASKSDLDAVLREIIAQEPNAVFSTVIGKPAQLFYKMYDAAGIDRAKMPIASLTMAETEMKLIGSEICSGHILAATYFQTIDSDANGRFVRAYKDRFGEEATTSVWSQAAYNQVHLFAKALAAAGSTDAEKLSQALLQIDFASPEGKVSVDADTRHLWLTPRIGVQRGNGLFDLEWEAAGPIKPDPYLATARFEETWIET